MLTAAPQLVERIPPGGETGVARPNLINFFQFCRFSRYKDYLHLARLYYKTRGLQLSAPGTHLFLAGPGGRYMKDWEGLRCVEHSGRGNANAA